MSAIETFMLSKIRDSLGSEFKQAKTRFYKFFPDFSQLVHIHFHSTGNDTTVTVDFGVIVPKIFQLMWSNAYKESDFKKLTVNNGIFQCNINDVITDFQGKPRVRYWDVEAGSIDEIVGYIDSKLVPFMSRFNSLESLDELIDTIPFPRKNSTDKPVMRLTLKLILGKDDEFYQLATKLKSEKNHFVNIVDELLLKKTFE